MAKCRECGTDFDYDNYYGICPKCGVYHKEKPPEEGHQQQTRERENSQPAKQSQIEAQRDSREAPKQGERRTSVSSVVGFICILTGLVLGIVMPIVFITVNMVELMAMEGSEMVLETDVEDLESATGDYEEDETEKDYKTKEIPQSPAVTTVNPGEPYVLGAQTQCQFTVQSASIVSVTDSLGLLAGYQLVAVNVSYENPNNNLYSDYTMSAVPYVGISNNEFRECMDKYELEQFPELAVALNVLDVWDISADVNGNGVFLVLVPTGVTELTFYMDSRQESTNDILNIYAVPLTIEAGEGL